MCVCMHTSLYSYIKSKMVCQCSSISVISLLFQISSFHLHFVHYFQPLLFWNFWKALQRRIFLRFLLFRVSVSKTEATVTVLTEQLSLEMHLFGFVHAAEIPPGMLCSTCHALDISNLTWKRNPVWFHQNQWQLTPKKFTLQLILQPFPSSMLSFGSAVTPHPRWRNNHSCISISELWANIPAAPCVIRD